MATSRKRTQHNRSVSRNRQRAGHTRAGDTRTPQRAAQPHADDTTRPDAELQNESSGDAGLGHELPGNAAAPETPSQHAPRIVEERRVMGPYGEQGREVVDEYGRRFWSLRPGRPERYDVMGFGWFWWLVLWLIVIGLIVWGWGWGWAY